MVYRDLNYWNLFILTRMTFLIKNTALLILLPGTCYSITSDFLSCLAKQGTGSGFDVFTASVPTSPTHIHVPSA